MASSSSGLGDSSSKDRSSASGVVSPEEPLRNWLELPREVTASIFSRLVATEILKTIQFVCRSWFDICRDPLVWRKINMYNLGEAGLNMVLDRMCRHAVNRSRGNLVDINIEYFGNDDLLKYITDSASAGASPSGEASSPPSTAPWSTSAKMRILGTRSSPAPPPAASSCAWGSPPRVGMGFAWRRWRGLVARLRKACRRLGGIFGGHHGALTLTTSEEPNRHQIKYPSQTTPRPDSQNHN